MQKAKQVAREFLSGDGSHKTTIDQDTRGAVEEEHVRPHQHEDVTTAVDRDVHQEHHQTRVQPVKSTETLPEKHTQNVLPTENKTFEHGRDEDTRRTLEQDASRFKSTSRTHDTTHSTSVNPELQGERIHHHVHEHIQPVIQKETVAPESIHTIAPVHETHHVAPVHHETTTLPTKTMEEFTKGGVATEGVGARTVGEYEGCPKPFREDPDAQQRIHGGMGHKGQRSAAAAGGEGFTGTSNEGYAQGTQHRSKLGRQGSSSSSSSDDERTAGRTTRSTGLTGASRSGRNDQSNVHGDLAATGSQKPSLMDKLNPRKDADGDGKAGLMD